MNINQIPEPPIKPTRTPSIVKDQDKEARFAAGQSLADMHTNVNAEPHKGGFIENVRAYVEEQNRIAQQRMQEAQSKAGAAKPRVRTRTKKKGNPAWAIIFVFFWIGISALGAIIPEEGFEDLSPAPVSTGTFEVENTVTLEDLETLERGCFTIDLPKGTDIDEVSIGGACGESFDEGYVTEYQAFTFENSQSLSVYLYADIDEFFFSNGFTGTLIEESNGAQLYAIEDSFVSSEQYLLWLRGTGAVNRSGDELNAVSLYLWNNNGLDKEVMDAIAKSITFTSFGE